MLDLFQAAALAVRYSEGDIKSGRRLIEETLSDTLLTLWEASEKVSSDDLRKRSMDTLVMMALKRCAENAI